MVAVCSHTGRLLDRRADIIQSIVTILTTPIGSRVRRRDYGSMIPDLIDSPTNGAGLLMMVAATADAIARWEPRVKFGGAVARPSFDGTVTLELDLTDRETGDPIPLMVPLTAQAGGQSA